MLKMLSFRKLCNLPGQVSKKDTAHSIIQNCPSTSTSSAVLREENNPAVLLSDSEDKNVVDIGVNTTRSIEDSNAEDHQDDHGITEIISDAKEVGETSNENELSEWGISNGEYQTIWNNIQIQVEIEVPRGAQNIQNGLIQFLQEVELEGYECAR